MRLQDSYCGLLKYFLLETTRGFSKRIFRTTYRDVHNRFSGDKIFFNRCTGKQPDFLPPQAFQIDFFARQPEAFKIDFLWDNHGLLLWVAKIHFPRHDQKLSKLIFWGTTKGFSNWFPKYKQKFSEEIFSWITKGFYRHIQMSNQTPNVDLPKYIVWGSTKGLLNLFSEGQSQALK